ncbi:MAG: alpha/beta fold hydrolase [Burkholderiaceae bacterium]
MPAPLKLLCLPPAGASASMYVRWKRSLPGWVDVVPVELPGRGARFGEAFVEDFDTLVERLCREHVEGLTGPYAMFGHSMGGLLAHGIARRQRARHGRLPAVLLVSGCPAPSQRDPDRFVGTDDDAGLIEDMRKQGGTPEEVFANEEMLRLTLTVLGADYGLVRSYAYRPAAPLPMPLHVFAGKDDEIEPERIDAWRQEAGHRFSVEWFDGGHFFVRHREDEVLRAMTDRLSREWLGGGRHAAHSVA